jgi:uncharacterized membrane protein
MMKLMIAGLFTNFKLPPFVDFFGVIVPLEIVEVFIVSTVVLFVLFVLLWQWSRAAHPVEQQSNGAKVAFVHPESRVGGR